MARLASVAWCRSEYRLQAAFLAHFRPPAQLASFGAAAPFVVTPQGVSAEVDGPLCPGWDPGIGFVSHDRLSHRLPTTGYRLPATTFWLCFSRPILHRIASNSFAIKHLAPIRVVPNWVRLARQGRFVVTPQGVSANVGGPLSPAGTQKLGSFRTFASPTDYRLPATAFWLCLSGPLPCPTRRNSLSAQHLSSI